MNFSGRWIDKIHLCHSLRELTLDILNSTIETYGDQAVSAYTRHTKYLLFLPAKVAVIQNLLVTILSRIARLAIPPRLVERSDSSAEQRLKNKVPCREGWCR